jgi:hypothetical protein
LTYDNSSEVIILNDGTTASSYGALIGSDDSWNPTTSNNLYIYSQVGPISISGYNFVVSGISHVHITIYNGNTEVGDTVIFFY